LRDLRPQVPGEFCSVQILQAGSKLFIPAICVHSVYTNDLHLV
jgi:hypothetical protein